MPTRSIYKCDILLVDVVYPILICDSICLVCIVHCSNNIGMSAFNTESN